MIVLGTSFLVDVLRGRRNALAKLIQMEGKGELICTTSINALELYRGAYISARKQENVEAVKKILESLLVLTISEDTYDIFGALSARLRSEGDPIGDLDLVIGSVTLVFDADIVTNDQHFNQIPMLKVISY
jgi:tRNA(fMet)-specific endonuclease VapC